jgi:hypothetical protein
MKKLINRLIRISTVIIFSSFGLIAISEGLRSYIGWNASAIISAAAQQPTVSGNCNVIGNNNVNCNTFNIGPSRLVLTDSLKTQLLSHMPDKNKIVHVNAIGMSNADRSVIEETMSFLKSSEYTVKFDSLTGMRIPAPDNKISFAERPDGYYLEIAPSAN